MTAIVLKTPEEIKALKESWHDDPCWDIEDTESFEAHREELIAYSNDCKKQWDAARNARKEKEQARLTEAAEKLGLVGLLVKIESLQTQLNKANDRIWHLENPNG